MEITGSDAGFLMSDSNRVRKRESLSDKDRYKYFCVVEGISLS